ncbi:short chain oxidoreductase/dehydrogenase [Aulographum hederae CBS 113979]|uniref:Short chain oxidoreductase/dehydrogenase n=1 Tax=Aulographum hederae CBS 113979 TaxID=1176131 RepID=A0A6G1H0V7_9PEZI|nr:short chain oxidoreductase/dehydrogenase [Aulographum hederae CBS 113979]
MSFPTPKVYLITGCSTGLGYHLSRSVLAAGHHFIATLRNPFSPTSAGGTVLPLDVTSQPDILESQLKAALNVHGRIDVLINNAGIAIAGVVETARLEDAMPMFETNFFGLVRLTQMVIPHMRKQGGGTIANISSGAAVRPLPVIVLYSASKSAVEGFTEALRGEIAAFGIRVLLAVPGGMRTGFVSAAVKPELPESYKGTMSEYVFDALMSGAGNEKIDPVRAAKRIVDAVEGSGMLKGFEGKDYLRLPIGSETGDGLRERVKVMKEETDILEEVWRSVDFEDGVPHVPASA